jgi:hypothetical protein
MGVIVTVLAPASTTQRILCQSALIEVCCWGGLPVPISVPVRQCPTLPALSKSNILCIGIVPKNKIEWLL